MTYRSLRADARWLLVRVLAVGGQYATSTSYRLDKRWSCYVWRPSEHGGWSLP